MGPKPEEENVKETSDKFSKAKISFSNHLSQQNSGQILKAADSDSFEKDSSSDYIQQPVNSDSDRGRFLDFDLSKSDFDRRQFSKDGDSEERSRIISENLSQADSGLGQSRENSDNSTDSENEQSENIPSLGTETEHAVLQEGRWIPLKEQIPKSQIQESSRIPDQPIQEIQKACYLEILDQKSRVTRKIPCEPVPEYLYSRIKTFVKENGFIEAFVFFDETKNMHNFKYLERIIQDVKTNRTLVYYVGLDYIPKKKSHYQKAYEVILPFILPKKGYEVSLRTIIALKSDVIDLKKNQGSKRTEKAKSTFKCFLCLSTFTRAFSAYYHLKMHFDIYKVKCKHCGDMYHHLAHYKEHSKTVHQYCVSCEAKFADTGLYARSQLRKMHTQCQKTAEIDPGQNVEVIKLAMNIFNCFGQLKVFMHKDVSTLFYYKSRVKTI